MKFYDQLLHSILLLLCMKSSFAFTLAEVWQATLAHSSEYQAAIHNRDAELEREQQSKAAFFPQISAQASYQRQPPSISSSKITHGWNVQLNQSIFDATRMAQYRQSQVNSQLAHSRLAQHHEDLLLKVSQVYFDLLLVRERILAVKAEKDAYQQQVKKAQEAFRNGTGTILDVHEAQAGYDGAVAKEVNETAEKLIIEDRLKNYTGFDAKQITPIKPSLLIEPYYQKIIEKKQEQWQKLALSNNPEYRTQQLAAQSQKFAVQAAKNNRLPKITANLGYQQNQYTSSYQNSDYRYMGKGLTASIQLNIPLYTGGENKSRIREAQAREAEALAQLDTIEQKIKLAVSQAHTEANAAYYQILAQKKFLKSSQLKLESTTMGHQFGLRNYLEIVQARQEVADAEQKLAQVQYRFLMAYLTLIKESGMGLEKAFSDKPIETSKKPDDL